ncbi:transposase [Methanoculleus sp. FWC-SCC1]|uniref:Transposase n=1 Tax=Methanoculleus frigidifontis TaxID=2584085 RepID=A0ABT8MCI0_9EURY|nr:transposase [Methanoculleus sp. FWC-SCC1]
MFHRYQGYPSEKGGSTGYDGYKKVSGNKLSTLVDRHGLPLACTVSPANVHDSQLYEPTLGAFPNAGCSGSSLVHLSRCCLRCTGDPPVQPEETHKKQYSGQQEIPDTPEAGKAVLVRSGTLQEAQRHRTVLQLD